jgi:hypothetical protein
LWAWAILWLAPATYFLASTRPACPQLTRSSSSSPRPSSLGPLLNTCGNHSTGLNTPSASDAMTRTSVVKMYGSRPPTHRMGRPLQLVSSSSITFMATEWTRAFYAALRLLQLMACAPHLMLMQIKTCFGICSVWSFTTIIIPMCFGFVDTLTYRLSHPSCTFALDSAVPQQTSAWMFDQVHGYLVMIRDSNCELFSPNRWAASAATIQSFVNGATGTRLPSHDWWVAAYENDAACMRIRDLVINPGKICKSTLKDVHYVYRQPLQQLHIVIKEEMMIFREPIRAPDCSRRAARHPLCRFPFQPDRWAFG